MFPLQDISLYRNVEAELKSTGKYKLIYDGALLCVCGSAALVSVIFLGTGRGIFFVGLILLGIGLILMEKFMTEREKTIAKLRDLKERQQQESGGGDIKTSA